MISIENTKVMGIGGTKAAGGRRYAWTAAFWL